MNRILTIILLLVLSVRLVGCTSHMEPPSSNNSLMIAPSDVPNIIDNDTDKCFYLTEESTENIISVQVPVVTTVNEQAINTCIKEQVYQELQYWLLPGEYNLKESVTPITNINERIDPSEYSSQYLQITSRLSFESEELISIVFTGSHNVKSAAHPSEVFFSINVDVQTAERVGISDIYVVDESLYAAFLQHVTNERISRNELLSLNVFEEDIFLAGLAHEPKNGFYSYFTPNHVGISYPVAFALGNHIEAEIPYEDVKALYKTADSSVS